VNSESNRDVVEYLSNLLKDKEIEIDVLKSNMQELLQREDGYKEQIAKMSRLFGDFDIRTP